MNDAVYKFKRYEDDSLTYTGIDRHENVMVGGWDTVIDTSHLNQSVYADIPIVEERAEEDAEEAGAGKSYLDLEVGDVVMRRTFGEGMITSLDEKYICVMLSGRERKFKFPMAFEQGYLMV